ncbi:hypothetical protein [Methylobacterium sp. E-005]|uniref:hypothetical protein n=1 Tax=Methylobacterium sp. E-005 TaxID=2836549 RepID=UPI001FB8C968|nr:hypothetical protein [Methylobacterium sp. E-005]
MAGGFGSALPSFASGDDQTGLSPELRAWLQSQGAPSAVAVPPAVDGALAQRGLPSMSSVLNGMMSGATGDAQAVGDAGSRIGGMLSDMLGRSGDLIGKFRDGTISPSEFLGAAAGRARDAATSIVTAPQRAYSGELPIWDPTTGHTTDEAQNAANGLAGLAMTGSLPFKAPAGALRSFGGGQSLDDLLASMDSAISAAKPTLEPPPPGPRLLDPNAKSWDLYHGSTPGQDFQRFDPSLANNPAERGAVFFAPDPETAAAYAGSPKAGAEAGSRVFRATVDPGKTGVFDLSHLAETDPAFSARARELTVRDSSPGYGSLHDGYMETYRARREGDRDIARQVAEMGFPVSHDPSGNISYGWGHIGAAIERAQQQGLDTAILRNLAEHGGDDQVVALTPNRVRSAYAPDQLLYSGGPGGAAAGLPALAQTGDFDPLTGTVISGTPRPIGGQQSPSQPTGGAPSAAGPQSGPQQSLMERFAQGLNSPDLSNLLMNVSIGLLTNRGIGAGIGAGLQGYQQSRMGDVKQQLQMYQLQQQVQQQNATRAYLRGKGLSPDQVEAATLNPAILSSIQSQMNKDPQQFTVGGNIFLGRPDQDPSTWRNLGPSGIPLDQEVRKADALATVKDAHAKDDIVTISDGQGGTIAVNKSNLFPSKDAAGNAAAGDQGGNSTVRTLVPPQPDKKANEGLDKLIGDNITGGYQKAQGAVGTLAAISRQKEALDKGVISGSGADWRTQAQAIGAQLLGIDPSQLNASYNFDAASTQKQAELAKAVSQAGHTTNMDLQLGKTIAGGDRSKTEQALRQIVDAQETLARHAIDAHNASLDRYAKIAPEAAARTGFFHVDTPEVYRYGQGTPNPLADPGARLPVPGDALGMARAAIARGAPRDAVIGRLRQNNIDPGSL